jgi:hypothetical protein
MWFFDGEFVVNCVVERGGLATCFCALKICQIFKLFLVPQRLKPLLMGG